MKKPLTFVFVLLVALSAFAGEKEKLRKSDKKIPDQYIVVFNDKVVDDVEAVASDLAYVHKGKKLHVYKNALKGFSVNLSEARIRDLAEDPRVSYVEEDGEVTASATQSGATWGLDRIDQRDMPLNSSYTYNTTATNVTAYIIDTGILATHNEFGGRVRSGYSAIADGGGSNDCNGHGTHVAGTVGGSTWGVAKGVRLVAVRVLDCAGSGSNSGVIAGVDWVTADHAAGAPAVANMSLGGGASSALDTAVNNSIADGVTYAVASGNSNVDACSSSPARVANAITVNSTTNTDARSSFSNFGTCTDIFAPGSNITSAWYTSTTATNTISGTSMATPHVAGVAALYLAGNTGASPSTVWVAIRDSSTANKVTNPGTGSPNRLLYSLLTGTAPPPPPPPPAGSQLLANPGFESGNVSWTTTAGVISNSTSKPAYAGSWYAWLCGYGSAHTDSAYQQISIPSTATSATLSFYLRIDSAETTTTTQYDKLSVQILNSSGTLLATLGSYSNLNKSSSYSQKSFSVLAYKGQTIRVRFYATEDSTLQTSFVVDNTALNVQ
ncbi:MAG TPA: S8 family peptidase [Thermoanaerobaculia bacterium]|nr:S8 family peptidase [Thermoanaerobaculia bacterium]